jgi:hypothetical protein
LVQCGNNGSNRPLNISTDLQQAIPVITNTTQHMYIQYAYTSSITNCSKQVVPRITHTRSTWIISRIGHVMTKVKTIHSFFKVAILLQKPQHILKIQ